MESGNKPGPPLALGICVMGFLFLVLVFTLGVSAGVRWERKKAVESGAGRWEADPADGTVEFFYKTPPNPAK